MTMPLNAVRPTSANSMELTYDGPMQLSVVAATVMGEVADLLQEPLGVSGDGNTLTIHRTGNRPDFSLTTTDNRHFQLTEMGILTQDLGVLHVTSELRERLVRHVGV